MSNPGFHRETAIKNFDIRINLTKTKEMREKCKLKKWLHISPFVML